MFELPASDAELTQGDILSDCPVVTWNAISIDSTTSWQAKQSIEQVIVLTQACDLANAKATQVQVALIHSVDRLVALGVMKPAVIKDQIRFHRV